MLFPLRHVETKFKYACHRNRPIKDSTLHPRERQIRSCWTHVSNPRCSTTLKTTQPRRGKRPGSRLERCPHLQSRPLPTHFLLGQVVGQLGGDSVPDVRGKQSSPVVLRLNTGRAHLLPPRGHWLRIPGLLAGHCRQKRRVKEKKLLAGRSFFYIGPNFDIKHNVKTKFPTDASIHFSMNWKINLQFILFRTLTVHLFMLLGILLLNQLYKAPFGIFSPLLKTTLECLI